MTIEEKIKELREPAEHMSTLSYRVTARNGEKRTISYPYVKYPEYIERMDKIFGCAGYHTEYSMPEYHSLCNGQEYLTCKCRITILGEQGEPLLVKEGIGSREIQMEEGGKCSNLKNLPLIVQKFAFKAACQEFSIFGYDSGLDEEGGSVSFTEKTSGKKKSEDKPEHTKTFQTIGEMYEIRKDSHSGRPVFKLLAKELGEGTTGEQSSEIIFYPNRYQNLEEKINRLVLETKGKSVKLLLNVKEAEPRNNKRQYIFCSFS